MLEFCKEKKIDYIYVSEYERSEFNINEEIFSKLDKIASFDSISLYKVK